MDSNEAGLIARLELARELGFLGPGGIEGHLGHSQGFATLAEAKLGRAPTEFADLGTGGGIPGLVLARRWTGTPALFVEAGERRAAVLVEAVEELGWAERVVVADQRAEAVAQERQYREHFELVTARSFAPPPVTAEIASGLVQVGGLLVVSEPPEPDERRWPDGALEVLGFGRAERVEVAGAHFAVVRKEHSAPARYPRIVGRPAKRPLW